MAGGSFSASRPNKFFGRRGRVMKIMEITPFIPPYSKWEKDGRNPYLKGNKNVVARFILAYSIM
jgi:hypothetical protein